MRNLSTVLDNIIPPSSRKGDIRPLLSARLELYGAWKAYFGNRVIPLGKMQVNSAEGHIDLRMRRDDMIDVLPLLNIGGNDAILLVESFTVQRNHPRVRHAGALCVRLALSG